MHGSELCGRVAAISNWRTNLAVVGFIEINDGFLFVLCLSADYDPQVIEQKEQSQPSCLPLSYVLRFITDAARKEGPFLGTSGAELKRKLAIKHHSYSMSSSNRSNTPTGRQTHILIWELCETDIYIFV